MSRAIEYGGARPTAEQTANKPRTTRPGETSREITTVDFIHLREAHKRRMEHEAPKENTPPAEGQERAELLDWVWTKLVTTSETGFTEQDLRDFAEKIHGLAGHAPLGENEKHSVVPDDIPSDETARLTVHTRGFGDVNIAYLDETGRATKRLVVGGDFAQSRLQNPNASPSHFRNDNIEHPRIAFVQKPTFTTEKGAREVDPFFVRAVAVDVFVAHLATDPTVEAPKALAVREHLNQRRQLQRA